MLGVAGILIHATVVKVHLVSEDVLTIQGLRESKIQVRRRLKYNMLVLHTFFVSLTNQTKQSSFDMSWSKEGEREGYCVVFFLFIISTPGIVESEKNAVRCFDDRQRWKK